MSSDDKKTKTNPAQKDEAPRKKKDEAAPKNKSTSGADRPKTEGGEMTADAPSGYSRGEGQKPVSKAYKDNWNAIYAKKKKR
ncbi:MAG: hypothetical protein WA743_12060 [Pseudolabrys sp.]